MLLRKLVAALCPLLLCILVCAGLRVLDGWLGSTSFFAFLLEGVLLGAALALMLPLAGIRARTNGLTGWLLLGAGLLLLVLIYQYLEATGVIHVPLLRSMMMMNGQVVFVEGATMSYLILTALLYRRR